MNFQEEYKIRVDEANEILEEYMPVAEGFSHELAEAMNYALSAGGKRLRPVLMKAVFDLFGGEGWAVEPFMAGIEMIHTHSLIHDDLPAIDNDDYRRGRLTTHKVYGEAMGIIAGDALLNYAYETMIRAYGLTENHYAVTQALKVISRKTGVHGMLGGQSVDVQNDGRIKSAKMLEYIYENKTSALIEASMMTGAILAGTDKGHIALVEKAARMIGMAFQIRDDVLDVTGDESHLGKPVHSDERNHKITYASLRGIEGAAYEVERFSQEASGIIASFGGDDDFLLSLVRYLMTRDN